MSLKVNTDEIKGKLSSIVNEQLPEFVQSDHTTFATFIEAYYEWLEENGNAIERTRNLRLYNDIDKTVDEFVTYFKRNYLIDIPDNIIADKRLFLKHVKDFYQSKGTDKSLILLFRLLFNEEVEVYYPKRDMLRISDGNFNSETVLNLINVTGPVTSIVGESVNQANNPTDADINAASGLIENFVSFSVGANTVYQLTLTENSVNGTFIANQQVTITTPAGVVTGTIDEIITDVDITVGGAYYKSGDPLATKNANPFVQLEDASGNIKLETGDYVIGETIGDGASFDITAVKRGSLTGYLIESGGEGYALGDTLSYTETNLGSSQSAEVSRVERQLVTEVGENNAILLETGDKILMGDFRRIAKEDGDQILLETGDQVIPEDADKVGVIQDIKIVNEGSNFTQLPLVGVTSDNGTGAEIYATSTDIGAITGVSRVNFGTGYNVVPEVTPRNHMILTNISGTFVSGESVTSDTEYLKTETGFSLLLETGDKIEKDNQDINSGTLTTFDTDRNLYSITPDALVESFDTSSRLVGVTSGATADIHQCDVATITPKSGTVSTTEGQLFGADGRLSESSKNIQDSFYYQEFSYVIKVGNSINVWRDAVKRILHPVGLALFGEVAVSTSVRANLWGGSNIRLNGNQPRFKQIQQLLSATIDATMSNRAQKFELELFAEVANASLFPTRIMLEDGGLVLNENSEEKFTNKGKNFLRGEDTPIGTESGGIISKLEFPSHADPIANINATMQLLKDITLMLREDAASFDESVSIPDSPNNTTADGNQHGRAKQSPDVELLIHTFEQYVNDITIGKTVKHQLEIFQQVAPLARIIQNAVHLLLPTIKSTDVLTATSSSKLHLIASLGLEDAHLHETYGSAKLGSTGYSLDRFKFLFPPYSAGTRSIDRGGRIYRGVYNSNTLTSNYSGSNTSNDTYWDTYANTNISHLNEFYSVGDLVDFPGRKSNFAFDSEILLRSS